MSIIGRINRISDVLNTRGLDKTASDLQSTKEAMFGMPNYDVSRQRPPLQSERVPGRPTPSDPNTPAYKVGDFVIELNPSNSKEELMMWDGRRLVPKVEIEHMIDTGAMREERLFDQYEKAPSNVKSQMRPLLEFAKSKRTFGNLPRGEVGTPFSRLASITTCLEKRGYTLLVKRIKNAVDEYSKMISE